MWLRSQNRRKLVNVNMVGVEQGTTNFSVIASVDGNVDNSFIAGEYEAEERALEIVDQIQLRIVRGTTFDEIKTGGIKTIRDFVFQMPIK